ncbi:hypothetical protein LSUE1_G008085 [Lachnellula suecica]|uniref:F-box domain-containing protein n=1 Tax=Lachnellula suecica TaxID=602035 RepID=A0A8T9BVY3_9HELO|nr:hypothetical protein LSUE1_G008085 [Lachnellula suecica]
MVADPTGMGALPSEILISILSHFLTRDLLSLTPTCHLFHNVILRILQCRLLEAASHKDHKLILECYHPSAKFYTPYLHCAYLGTAGLNTNDEGICGDETTGSLGKLSKLYSYFRPLKPDENRRALRPHPAGGWPALPPIGLVDKHERFVCQDIHLDSHELFCQLVTVTNLVKLGPKPGVFKSSVNIGEGLTRVWRDWLSDRVSCCDDLGSNEREKRLLWSDSGNHVGMRMNVEERREIPPPIMLRSDEDPPVSYTLQYEELAIRTSQLLLMVEQSFYQKVNSSSKSAIVIGSWID